jgi:hypothetical protein
MIIGVVIHVQTRQKSSNWMAKPQFIINHEGHATLEEAFHIVKRLIKDFMWWKLVSLPSP